MTNRTSRIWKAQHFLYSKNRWLFIFKKPMHFLYSKNRCHFLYSKNRCRDKSAHLCVSTRRSWSDAPRAAGQTRLQWPRLEPSRCGSRRPAVPDYCRVYSARCQFGGFCGSTAGPWCGSTSGRRSWPARRTAERIWSRWMAPEIPLPEKLFFRINWTRFKASTMH